MKKTVLFIMAFLACLTMRAQGMHWTPVDEGLYSGSTTVIAVVQVNGVEQSSTEMELAVFCGDECRGTALTTEFPITHRFLALVNVYGEIGHELSFKAYDHATDQELEMDPVVTVTFTEDGSGTLLSPLELNFVSSTGPSSIVQATAMSQGWNWYSTYIELNDIDGLTMLENSMGANGVIIKYANQYVQNMGAEWMGSLESLTNERCYKIQTSAECAVTMRGPLARPADHPIEIQPKWNWIGYPVAYAQNVTTALDGFQPSANDIIKGQNGYATYLPGLGWIPEFTLEPGKGYMYYSNNTTNQTLVYSANSGDALEDATDALIPVSRDEPIRLLVQEDETITELEVFDAFGAVVRHKTSAWDSHTIEGLPESGVYLVKVACKSGNRYQYRLIVK